MRCTLRPKFPWPAEAQASCRGKRRILVPQRMLSIITEGAAGCGALIPNGMNASFALAVSIMLGAQCLGQS